MLALGVSSAYRRSAARVVSRGNQGGGSRRGRRSASEPCQRSRGAGSRRGNESAASELDEGPRYVSSRREESPRSNRAEEPCAAGAERAARDQTRGRAPLGEPRAGAPEAQVPSKCGATC
jgi:hypothetical protein